MIQKLLQQVRRALVAGTLVLLPLGVTLWVFVTLINVADGLLNLVPKSLQPETYLGYPIPGTGVLATFLLVLVVGVATRYYTGRRIVELYEAVLLRVPVLSGVYQGFKQLVETLFTNQGRHFRQVVLIEYPRPGAFAIAFLTNEHSYLDIDDIEDSDRLVSVFLPTTPNPTSGFYLMLRREEIRVCDISVEEAFKLIMSAGIVGPAGTRVAQRVDRPALESTGTEG